jgi:hypothetical protein
MSATDRLSCNDYCRWMSMGGRQVPTKKRRSASSPRQLSASCLVATLEERHECWTCNKSIEHAPEVLLPQSQIDIDNVIAPQYFRPSSVAPLAMPYVHVVTARWLDRANAIAGRLSAGDGVSTIS